jgi:hypothetical protein
MRFSKVNDIKTQETYSLKLFFLLYIYIYKINILHITCIILVFYQLIIKKRLYEIRYIVIRCEYE